MATPTRSQGVTTPRNPLTSTPNRPTASPRPNTAHLQNRAFTQSSPNVKTPASSGQGAGHSHRFSVSSQPTSTPMAAPAIHDELLNLNSPAAALIASIGGTTGLTPLPISSAQDGLGITAGIIAPALGLQDPTITGAAAASTVVMPRNPAMERVHRLQEVARLLETRSLGRGVTRKGVTALAQKNKFDQQWDGNQVNIAGTSVDLELTFQSSASGDPDMVRDVTLNLVTDVSGDPQPQKSASAMLKRQLILGEDDNDSQETSKGPWRDLNDFAANLQYLSHHDRLPCQTNAFQLVGGLYETFQKIWLEEKKRMKGRHEAFHICQGNVGRPAMDVGKKLGLCSHYWINQHEYTVAEIGESDVGYARSDLWSARFSLDVGEPSITSNQDWLAPEVLDNSVVPENVFQSNQAEQPKWQDTNTASKKNESSKQEDMDVMDLEGPSDQILESLGVHFISDFDPHILVPINVVTELNNSSPMLQMEQAKVTTIQQALQSEVDRYGSISLMGLSESRWTKTLSVFDKDGVESHQDHAYMLFANGVAWCYPVTQLQFSHPRQFSEALPILRQYVLLWSLLRKTVVDESGKAAIEVPNITSTAQSAAEPTPTIKRRSNKKQARVELEQLLPRGNQDKSDKSAKSLNIDISLNLMSDIGRSQIDVLIPIREHNSFIQVSIVVHRNGIIDVASISGMPPSYAGDEDKLKRHSTRIISLSEDIGVLAQWLIRKISQKSA